MKRGKEEERKVVAVLTKLVVKSFTFRLLLYKPSRSLNDLLDSLAAANPTSPLHYKANKTNRTNLSLR